MVEGPARVVRRLIAVLCLAACSSLVHAEPVPLPDDLKLPSPAAGPSAPAHPMLGAWIGDAWSGVLPQVLVVESVASDGQATVVSAIGAAPEWKITLSWSIAPESQAIELLSASRCRRRR